MINVSKDTLVEIWSTQYLWQMTDPTVTLISMCVQYEFVKLFNMNLSNWIKETFILYLIRKEKMVIISYIWSIRWKFKFDLDCFRGIWTEINDVSLLTPMFRGACRILELGLITLGNSVTGRGVHLDHKKGTIAHRVRRHALCEDIEK